MPKLTKTVVEGAEPREKQFTLWCSELKGFGVFVQPSGTRTYFVDYRNEQNKRHRMTLGRHGVITAEEARKLAIGVLGQTVRGEDPAEDRASRREAMTVAELCKDYLAAADKGLILGKGDRPKKASTLYTDRGRIARHIIPLLGSMKVVDLTKVDINRFIRDVASGKTAKTEKTKKLRGKSVVKGGSGTATRTTGLLGGILSYAVSDGIIETNPVDGVRRPANQHRTRRLTPDEYRKLGQALEEASADGETAQVVDGAWLIALSGCRLGEIVNLKWSEVDVAGSCLRLDDSKEGASIRPAGRPLLDRISSIKREEECPTVLVPVRKGQAFGGMPRGWKRIMERAGLVGVTPHTMRHSFASVAGDLGVTEPTIAALLGHAAGSVTSRYVHHLDAVLIATVDKVATSVYEMMMGVVDERHGSDEPGSPDVDERHLEAAA